MEEAKFTIFHDGKGDGILICNDPNHPAYGQTFNPSMRGDDPVTVTREYMELLDTLLSQFTPEGEPFFVANPATIAKALLPNSTSQATNSDYAQPQEGMEWTHGKDDRLIITRIAKRVGNSGSVMYDFFSLHKTNPQYAVRSLKESDLGNHKIIAYMGSKMAIEGEFLLTVKLGALKDGKNARYAESYKYSFVGLESVKD